MITFKKIFRECVISSSVLCQSKGQLPHAFGTTAPVFSYMLRYIVGLRLVEMAISTNLKPAMYRNMSENTCPGIASVVSVPKSRTCRFYCVIPRHIADFNPCPAQLFQIIFHSFKAGIANAISSFKWRKIFIFMKNKHFPNWNIWSAEHLPLNILSISLAFYLGWNFIENVYIRVQQHKG